MVVPPVVVPNFDFVNAVLKIIPPPILIFMGCLIAVALVGFVDLSLQNIAGENYEQLQSQLSINGGWVCPGEKPVCVAGAGFTSALAFAQSEADACYSIFVLGDLDNCNVKFSFDSVSNSVPFSVNYTNNGNIWDPNPVSLYKRCKNADLYCATPIITSLALSFGNETEICQEAYAQEVQTWEAGCYRTGVYALDWKLWAFLPFLVYLCLFAMKYYQAMIK